MTNGRKARLGESAGPPLVREPGREVDAFASCTRSRSSPRPLEPGTVVRAVIGLDGGSTSSKAVLVDEEGEIVCKAYQLSKGNPIKTPRSCS
jgi:activator of 2-hydroxyglutaryl-CoA dehydratase